MDNNSVEYFVLSIAEETYELFQNLIKNWKKQHTMQPLSLPILITEDIDDDVHIGRFDFQMYLRERGISDIAKAFNSDNDFGKLFTELKISRFVDCRGDFYWHLPGTGGGGTTNLEPFIENLIFYAHCRCRLKNDNTPISVAEECLATLKLIRRLINKEEAHVQEISYLHGVGTSEIKEIDIESRNLAPITSSNWDLILDSREAFTSDDASKSGILLVEEVPIDLTIGSVMEPAKSMSFSSMIEQIQLALAIVGIKSSNTGSARLQSKTTLNPLTRPSAQWTDLPISTTPPWSLSKEDFRSLIDTVAAMKTRDGSAIAIAEQRLLQALNHRSSPLDQIIDASIGLENLFGEQNYSSKAIAIALARLLGKTEEKRIDIHDDAKKLYGTRSKLVHGGKIKNPDQTTEFARTTIKYLADSIFALYSDTDESLISMKSHERFKKLALR